MAIVTSVQGVYSKFQSVLFLQGLLVCCGRLCGCWWSIRIPKIIRRFPKQKRPILLRALLGIVQLRYHNFFSTRGFFLLKVFFYSRFFSTRGFFLLEFFSTQGFFLLEVFFYSRFSSTRGFFLLEPATISNNETDVRTKVTITHPISYVLSPQVLICPYSWYTTFKMVERITELKTVCSFN